MSKVIKTQCSQNSLSDSIAIWVMSGLVALCFVLWLYHQYQKRQKSIRCRQKFEANYLSRPFVARQWYRAFPDSSKSTFRSFLSLFSLHCGLSKTEICYLSPYDKFDEFIETTSDSTIDINEFVDALEETYNISVLQEPGLCRNTVTLGDIFAVAHKKMMT